MTGNTSLASKTIVPTDASSARENRFSRPAARIGVKLASLVAIAALAVAVSGGQAGALQYLNYSGSTGQLHGPGLMTCNPFPSNGSLSRYVELGAPMVWEARQIRPVYVGGNQQIYWRPQLEKLVNGQWRAIWLGAWGAEVNTSVPSTFPNLYLDVYRIAGGGRGYYRMSGTIWWLADQNYDGGWLNYRLSGGNYFRDGSWHPLGTAPTPVSTPYCYIA